LPKIKPFGTIERASIMAKKGSITESGATITVTQLDFLRLTKLIQTLRDNKSVDPEYLKFLGLELTNIYSELSDKFSKEGIVFLIIAILAGVSQYFTTKFTQLMQNPQAAKSKKKKKTEELSPEALQENMSKSFNYVLPVMTILFAIRMPAFLGLYWVAQSFALIAQYVLLDWDKTKKGVQNLISVMKKGKGKGNVEAEK